MFNDILFILLQKFTYLIVFFLCISVSNGP